MQCAAIAGSHGAARDHWMAGTPYTVGSARIIFGIARNNFFVAVIEHCYLPEVVAYWGLICDAKDASNPERGSL